MSKRVGDGRTREVAVQTSQGQTRTVQLTLPVAPEYLSLVRLTVGAVAALGGAPPDVTADLKLAVTEACANSVQHAHPGGTNRDTRLTVRVSLEPGLLTIGVTDHGVGIDPERVSFVIDEGEQLERGMGLPIIRAVTDTLDVSCLGPGTRLLFSRQFTPG